MRISWKKIREGAKKKVASQIQLKADLVGLVLELPGGVHIVLVFAQERHLNDMSIYNIYRVNKKNRD